MWNKRKSPKETGLTLHMTKVVGFLPTMVIRKINIDKKWYELMVITEERKREYIADVHAEMSRRGMTESQITNVISKTGFEEVMEKYPEEQMHYDVSDAVNEIILVAAISS